MDINKIFGAFNSDKEDNGVDIPTPDFVKSMLNENHPRYSNPDSIGTIFFTDEDSQEITSEVYSLPTAKPINRNNFITPLIGEVVEVIQSISGDYYKDLGGKRTNKTYYYYLEV